jgi:hypothetical protein
MTLMSTTFPDPHNALYICKTLGVEPSRTIMVGDTPGVIFTKLFTAVSRVFVSGKPFQPSQIFVGEARSLP